MISKNKEQLLKENEKLREDIKQLKRLTSELRSKKTRTNNNVKECEGSFTPTSKNFALYDKKYFLSIQFILVILGYLL